MARFDLTDFEWSVIEPLLPTKVRGVARVDDRRVLNGIFWRLRTGAPWADIPARYGPHTTCVNRFNRWRKAGHWARILQAVSAAYVGGMLDTVEPGNILLADRAYDSDALRDKMSARGAWANIRAMLNRVKTFAFSAWVYRQRNAVEPFFNKLKHFRAIATRYDKRDDNFLASVQPASIRIWLRSYESAT